MFRRAAAKQPWVAVVSRGWRSHGLGELSRTENQPGAQPCHLSPCPITYLMKVSSDTKKQQMLRSPSGDSLQPGTGLVQNSTGANPLVCKGTGKELSGF